MTLKREIKDAYIEGGASIYVKTHSNAVYVDENETETLTQRLDNVKDSITKHTSQLNEIANNKIFTGVLNVTQNITTSGGNTVLFDTILNNSDKLSLDASNGSIKVLKEGDYNISSSLRISSKVFTNTKIFIVDVLINDTINARQAFMWDREKVGNTFWCNINTTLHYKENDIIKVQLNTLEDINYTVVQSVTQSYINIKEVI